jgi:GTPase SAR1 family protein
MAKLDVDLLQDLKIKPVEKTVDHVQRNPNTYLLNSQERFSAINVKGADQLEILTLGGQAADLEFLAITDCPNLKSITFLVELPRLKLLYLDNNALENIEIPNNCTVLEQLYLQKNQLHSLKFAADCAALQLLDASNNQLESLQLPAGFKKLTYLYLRHNQLQDLQLCEPLPALKTLHLRRNRLKRLPQNIVLESPLTALYLGGNAPKDIHRHFLGNGDGYYSEDCLEDARIWFKELANPADTEPNDYIKLMFLGNGNAGKSSLLYALQHGKCPEHDGTTHGIDIGNFALGAVKFNYWDFGGQEVYHGTHRLFMTSVAIQLILFDPETEQLAINQKRVQDRASKDQILNHPLAYWYEISKELSPDSHFCFVQNKIDKYKTIDQDIKAYARDKAAFFALSAQTGKDLEDLQYYLKNEAQALPEFGMLMPKSWLQVRQFFIDYDAEKEGNKKWIDKKRFAAECDKAGVSEISWELLFQYLHHSGFLYHHENLGDRIIADQRWALEAIYKPLDRNAAHYEELRDDSQGKIRVKKLFQLFGSDYKDDEKWLFLDFMKSCGLCFQLNNKKEDEDRSEQDVYIFPEFLPDEKPAAVVNDWANRAREVKMLRYQMPYLNYPQILTFISALGRKTDTDNIWRKGIHVSTPEGWFKVELDYVEAEKKWAILISIEAAAEPKWLEAILEELKLRREDLYWEISTDQGQNFKRFDLEEWKKGGQEKHLERVVEMEEATGQREPLSKKLKDVEQRFPEKVILFLASNPLATNNAAAMLSMRAEHSHIAEKLSERETERIFDLKPRFGVSPENMIDAINYLEPVAVHFVGHGIEQDPDTHSGGGLYFFSDDKQRAKLVDADILSKMFRRIKSNHPQLEIVLLNACYSEPQAQAISSHGIYTIGSNDELPSEAARLFAAGFYHSYALTKDVKRAMDNGLTQAMMANKGCDVETLIHLFYNGNRIKV